MRLLAPLFRKRGEVGEITKKFGNFPDSYVKKCVEEVEWKTPRGLPQYLPRKIVHKKKHFSVHSPWSGSFQKENEKGMYHAKNFVQPTRDWTFYKGDRVEILSGPDKGKQGIISQVVQERNFVFVEGFNCKLKVMGKTKSYPGVVIKSEQPLLINTEVKLVDPSDLKFTEIEWRYTEEGEKVRVSVRTGRIIPIPQQAQETHDYKSKSTYKESPKDTTSDDLTKISFDPKLETFEMSIMRTMGIEETRIPTKTYWY